MKKGLLPIVLLGLLLVSGLIYILISNAKKENPSSTTSTSTQTSDGSTVQKLTLTSPSFTTGNKIPAKYTCDGDDINPELQISGVPTGSASLVLIVDDPDATSGRWVHWVISNISPDTTTIAENSVPSGSTLGQNDFKISTYRGPCPPEEEHRYFFKLYALDIRLNTLSSSTAQDIERLMEGHILATSELIGIYER